MAEGRALSAASAEIGVAVASRLPSLSLSGMIGINRVVHGGDSTQSWSWGPSISLPLFEVGAGRARVETARARYDRALAPYHGQARVAVQEVEDALTRVDAWTGREAGRERVLQYV